ncbi:Abi family protein [Specibacter sp. AOP5-B1-6]|uniref:Abi family protein n=1 Tax=Specibacter sp. AOP5-B1-6 TaxID=3457653 RepID=UPI00402BEADA
MLIPSHDYALRDLRNVGYYRLAAYWYPFREIDHVDADGTVVRSDLLKPGTTFDDAHALWTFDQQLRLILLEALEQIEVALRVRTAHCIGAQDPFAHLNASHLDTARCLATVQTPQGSMTAHQWWVARYEEKLASTHDDILRLYRSRWELKPPVWVAVELLDFGMLSTFFRQFLTKAQQSEISRTFGISQGSFLVNWIKVLNHVRNMCAHHARVWNQPVTFRLQRIPTGMSPLLDPLNRLTGTPKTRIYSVLYLCAFLLDSLGDNSDWTNKAQALLASFPNVPGPTINDIGAPESWHTHAIWDTQI